MFFMRTEKAHARPGDRALPVHASGLPPAPLLPQAVVELATLEDMECQEYAAFALAHLASNRELQVVLVELGALKPLVSMMAVQAEPRHYAGLALLKLADNFENHVAIAKEGGIQALLRLGRTRTTDDELQYKASLTVGALASNAVKVLPRGVPGGAASEGAVGGGGGGIGTAAHMGKESKEKKGKKGKGKAAAEGTMAVE